jgi:hypothetical protein
MGIHHIQKYASSSPPVEFWLWSVIHSWATQSNHWVRMVDCCVFVAHHQNTTGWYAHSSVSVPMPKCLLPMPCGNAYKRLPRILHAGMVKGDILSDGGRTRYE